MEITINSIKYKSLDEIRNNSTKELYEFIVEYFNDKPYVVAHTSGSTGKPKEIRLLKSDMRVSADNTNAFFNLNSESLFYIGLSTKYIAGKMMIVRALQLGANIIDEKPSNEPLADYHGSKISLAAFVPSQIISLIRNPDRFEYIENIIIGGGAIAENIRKHLIDLGVNAYSTYGMTETSSHVALAPINNLNLPYELLGDISGSVDNDGALQLTLPSYSIGKLQTNDIVELIDSKHFYWRGRRDNVINSGGIKIHPEEVEPVIAKLLKKSRFFLTSLQSEKWGEELALAIEYPNLSDGKKKIGDIQPALVEEMKKILPTYSVPRKYIAVNKFHETATGKIIRKV